MYNITMRVSENLRTVGRRSFDFIKSSATRQNYNNTINSLDALNRVAKGLSQIDNETIKNISKKIPTKRLDEILDIAKVGQTIYDNRNVNVFGEPHPPSNPIQQGKLPSETNRQKTLDRINLAKQRNSDRRNR